MERYLESFQLQIRSRLRGRSAAVKSTNKKIDAALVQRLTERGFRFTPQREHVYSVLLENRDHPTAEQVFLRAKTDMPEISMATVYNCLDALVKCNLVRQVRVDRGPTHFCSNMNEHWHFYCNRCGNTFDIDIPATTQAEFDLPEGFQFTGYELSVRGSCPDCTPSLK